MSLIKYSAQFLLCVSSLQVTACGILHPLVWQRAVAQLQFKVFLVINRHVEAIAHFACAAVQAGLLAWVVGKGVFTEVGDTPTSAEHKALLCDVVHFLGQNNRLRLRDAGQVRIRLDRLHVESQKKQKDKTKRNLFFQFSALSKFGLRGKR